MTRRQKVWGLVLLAVIAVLTWTAISDGVGAVVDPLILFAIIFGIPYLFQRAARRADFHRDREDA